MGQKGIKNRVTKFNARRFPADSAFPDAIGIFADQDCLPHGGRLSSLRTNNGVPEFLQETNM